MAADADCRPSSPTSVIPTWPIIAADTACRPQPPTFAIPIPEDICKPRPPQRMPSGRSLLSSRRAHQKVRRLDWQDYVATGLIGFEYFITNPSHTLLITRARTHIQN